jgi:tRNA A-37 threonylcarbamoyl transferase component Bud32
MIELHPIRSVVATLHSLVVEVATATTTSSNIYAWNKFEFAIGKSIPNYNEFIERLQVDFHVFDNGVETVYDNNGDVESFFNILKYKTGYKNIHLISLENFDTKDHDYVQYKLSFTKN